MRPPPIYSKLFFLVFGLLLLASITRDVARGHIPAKNPPQGISRATQPGLFWFMTVVSYAFIIGIIVFLLTR
jgi:hypothetical protein